VTVEPMTDALHRPIDVQSILDRLRKIERGGGWINTVTLRSNEATAILDHIGAYAEHLAAMEARLDAERSRADAAEAARSEQHDIVARIWKHLGSPSYEELAGRSIYDLIGCLKAERDAAVARAMPAPRLMRTVEGVEALAAGLYLVRPRWDTETWMLAKRRPTRTWSILVGDGAAGVMDDNLVGAWVAGPLPTPTAAQEATDAP